MPDGGTSPSAPSSNVGETLRAVRNAFALGGSLLFTWSIAIVMRLVLPRYLGPERFGALSFADAFTATFFVSLGLGVEVYIRKEVSVRAGHGSDFIGGTFLIRALMTVALFLGMGFVLHVTNRPPEVRNLVWMFALAQFFVIANSTLSALLHAAGRVGGMSILSVAAKVAWAGGTLVAIACGAGLWAFAAALLVAEALRAIVLFWLVTRHLGLVFRVDVAATMAMVTFSLPYYANILATTAYGRLDITLLELGGSSREVGWYAAASAIAGLTLLATPLIEWVLTPMFARAAARSHDELFTRVRRATELILALAIPASLFISVGADVWVKLVFGTAFAPAVLALRIRAMMFVLTYVAIVYAITLTMLGRAWTLAAISLAGLVVNVGLNLLLLRRSIALFGEGGGGTGCALAMLGTEIFVTGAMVLLVRRHAIDRRTTATIVTSLAACALVVVVDRLASQSGWVRLVLDVTAYLVVVGAVGASRTREIVAIVSTALHRPSRVADGDS